VAGSFRGEKSGSKTGKRLSTAVKNVEEANNYE
jgi:hypothetical protein